MAIEPETGLHFITVQKLKDILNLLRDDDDIMPNGVYNLAVYRDNKWIGFIDTGAAEAMHFDEGEDDEIV